MHSWLLDVELFMGNHVKARQCFHMFSQIFVMQFSKSKSPLFQHPFFWQHYDGRPHWIAMNRFLIYPLSSAVGISLYQSDVRFLQVPEIPSFIFIIATDSLWRCTSAEKSWLSDACARLGKAMPSPVVQPEEGTSAGKHMASQAWMFFDGRQGRFGDIWQDGSEDWEILIYALCNYII